MKSRSKLRPFKQSAASHEPEEDSEVAVDSTLNNNRNQELLLVGRSIWRERLHRRANSLSKMMCVKNSSRNTLAKLAMAQPGRQSVSR